MRTLKLTISLKLVGLLSALVMPALALGAAALADSFAAEPAAYVVSSIDSALDSSALTDNSLRGSSIKHDSLRGWAVRHNAYSKPAEIQKKADQLSIDVLAKNIDTDAHFLTMVTQISDESAAWLALMDSLAARVPEYAKSPAISLARGSLHLKLAQLESARALLKPLLAAPGCKSTDESIDIAGICTPIVSAWLETGKVQAIGLHTILKVSAMADARSSCSSTQDQSLALTLALLGASLDKPTAARFAIRAAWPDLVAGCDGVAGSIREAIQQAYPANELKLAYAGALASVDVASPRSLLLFGEDLPLPLQECDFEKAANCSVGKALGKLTAGRIAQRLQLLSPEFNYQFGLCKNTSESEQERINALAKAFKTGVSVAVKLAVVPRAAALKSLLTAQFRPLGSRLNYLLADSVGELAKLDAAAALAVQQALIELLGTDASSYTWEKLAHLQLEAKQPQAALLSLQQALRLDYSSQTARLEATLSAILSGAEIAPPYEFDMDVARPWIFTAGPEIFESDDAEAMILAMLNAAQRNERQVKKRWLKVLSFAARLVGDEVEIRYLEEEFSDESPATTLKGRWFDNHIVLEGVQLPWPDQFAIEADGPSEAPQAISNAERTAIFKGFSIELQSEK